MRKLKGHKERGSSLLLAILALLLLSAIAVGMAFMSAAENSTNANFKAEETAYFAARAGVEEVRDRLLPSNTQTLNAVLPITLPGSSPASVLYVVPSGVTSTNISTIADPYADNEFCHDFNPPISGLTWVPPDVACGTAPPSGSYTTTASVAPYKLDYKWVRVTLKANNSAPYCVNGNCSNTNAVCWNGTNEVVLPGSSTNVPYDCNHLMSPVANPVYLVTALAVVGEGATKGARRLVQQEISQTPINSFNYGLYATGTGCGALSLAGGAQTYSFDSATNTNTNPANPPSNVVSTGGNVGSNGNVSIGGSGTSVNGTTGSAVAGIGNCQQGNGITVAGGGNYGTAAQIPTQTLAVPPTPNPPPPTSGCNTYCYNSSQTLPAGSYGNVRVSGGATVTLTGGTAASPAIYTMNSISITSGSLVIAPGSHVVLDIAGLPNVQVPVNLTGGTFVNNTMLPGSFVINYGGTGTIKLNGGSDAYAVINAPLSNIIFSGGSNFYGQAIGATISDSGGTNIYYDTSLLMPTVNNNAFFEIALRELNY